MSALSFERAMLGLDGHRERVDGHRARIDDHRARIDGHRALAYVSSIHII